LWKNKPVNIYFLELSIGLQSHMLDLLAQLSTRTILAIDAKRVILASSNAVFPAGKT
jgi:hypothetical protein